MDLGAALKVFDRKRKCVWLTAPDLEFRPFALHIRWRLRMRALPRERRGRWSSHRLLILGARRRTLPRLRAEVNPISGSMP